MFRIKKLNFTFSSLQAAMLCLLIACGGGDKSEPSILGVDPSTSDATVETFDASLGQVMYRSFALSNTSSQNLELKQISFSNNVCAAFSLHSITDTNGRHLSSQEKTNIMVAAGQKVWVNVKFDPISCDFVDYDTNLLLHLMDSNGQKTVQTTLLRSLNKAKKSDEQIVTCGEAEEGFEFVETFLSKMPEAGDLYLRINRMRAFIYPTAASDNATIFGTDIGIDPNTFNQPLIKIEVANDGSFVLPTITPCDDFNIPSSDSDRFFTGSSTRVTTNVDAAGQFEMIDEEGSEERIIKLSLTDLTIQLRADGIKDSSLIADENGIFQISVTTDLTTDKTAATSFLGGPLSNNDRFTKDVLNRELISNGEYALAGQSLNDGEMRLVGIGDFNEALPFIGDIETAKAFLIDDDAFIYIQMEVSLMERVEVTQ